MAMVKWLKRKLNLVCEFEDDCAYQGKWPCKVDHYRYKEGKRAARGRQTLFEKHVEYINNLNVATVTDVSFSAGLIWLHTKTESVEFSSGMGMYLSNELKDELIMTLWNKLQGTELAGKILHHMLNRKAEQRFRGGSGGPSAA